MRTLARATMAREPTCMYVQSDQSGLGASRAHFFGGRRDARGARYDHSVCKSLVAIVYMRAMVLILRRRSARHIREKRLQHEEDGDEGLHAE